MIFDSPVFPPRDPFHASLVCCIFCGVPFSSVRGTHSHTLFPIELRPRYFSVEFGVFPSVHLFLPFRLIARSNLCCRPPPRLQILTILGFSEAS